MMKLLSQEDSPLSIQLTSPIKFSSDKRINDIIQSGDLESLPKENFKFLAEKAFTPNLFQV